MRIASVVKASTVALAAAAAAALVVPNASARTDPETTASPAALAVVAADGATSAGIAGLAKGAGETFVRRDVVAGWGGLMYVSYERTYQGITVVGGDAVVVTDSAGKVLSVSSAMSKPVSMPAVTPAKTSTTAAAKARSVVPGALRADAPRQVMLVRDNVARLAWEGVVEGRNGSLPSRMHVFVDAATGAVLDRYDEVKADTGNSFYVGRVTIDATAGTPRRMVDPNRSGLSCGNFNNRQTFTNNSATWGNGSGTDLKTGCVDAYFAAEKEIDMLRTWLGRNGINGLGRNFPLFVGLNQVNAFWNGSSANFGHSSDNRRQATNIDVVAHEMGHAIFQFTPGGVAGGNENGGINEGTGDIFGALTEAFANNPNDPPDYTVGEEVNLVGQGPIRFMFDPSRAGDPNCFSSSIPGTEVHAAAGPLNHWFYLVAEGSNPTNGQPRSPTCNNSRVTGIGIRNAGRIYMGALNRKTSGWRYVNARVATLQAARQLFPNGCTEFNTVRAAWDAIRVPRQSNEPTCA
jgi:Zn-dependent metalloprotease